jgi:flagellar export protein FliJ
LCCEKLSALENSAAEFRAALVRAEQAVLALEILREKQHTQFLGDSERRQQRELDDVAARAVANRSST